MNTPTIHELRSRGFKVRVTHERVVGFNYRRFNLEDDVIHPTPLQTKDVFKAFPVLKRVTKAGKKAGEYPALYAKGGSTTVEITGPAPSDGGFPGPLTDYETAKCNIKDPFNRKLGIRICLARLAKKGVI